MRSSARTQADVVKHKRAIRTIGPRPLRYYGNGIPYLKETEIKGRLIVIEGPDASGRSTQIGNLIIHLEASGHAVLNTGLRRSDLIAPGLLEAKRNFAIGKKTLSLFYAADFADQLENKIVPALRAGYIVLADRYIFTLIARDSVRGISRTWSLCFAHDKTLGDDADAGNSYLRPAGAVRPRRGAERYHRVRSRAGQRAGRERVARSHSFRMGPHRRDSHRQHRTSSRWAFNAGVQ